MEALTVDTCHYYQTCFVMVLGGMGCLAASVCVTGDTVDVYTSVQYMARSPDADVFASFLAAGA